MPYFLNSRGAYNAIDGGGGDSGVFKMSYDQVCCSEMAAGQLILKDHRGILI